MKIIAGVLILAASAFAQQDNTPFRAQIQGQVQAQIQTQMDLAETQMDLAAARAQKAETAIWAYQANPAPFPAPAVIRTTPGGPVTYNFGGSGYDAGTAYLDQHKYDQAIQQFDRAIAEKSTRADGAYYWKAYTLNREGRRDDALAAIAALRQNFPSSGWLKDAQALEAEVRQGSGQAISPAQEADEDLKLMAINSLMNADPDRAIPLLDGLLKGNAGHKVKDRALFVLTQNHSPRAQQVLTDYAKGAGNPDLQSTAIRYLAMSGGKDAAQQLAAIYTATSDTRVKKDILQALMSYKDGDVLLNLAKDEKDPALRSEAIAYIASSRNTPSATLTSLYSSETDAAAKKAIVSGLSSRKDAKSLVELARKESDPAMKKTIVTHLSGMKSPEALDYMMELLK